MIQAMVASYSRHSRMKKLHFGLFQNARKVLLESITIGFELERFVIHIISNRDMIV